MAGVDHLDEEMILLRRRVRAPDPQNVFRGEE
jgi:hypothetical protein